MADEQRVNEFTEQVEHLYEVEIGDFRRKVGLYLNRLQSDLTTGNSPEFEDLFRSMRDRLLYTPHSDIEEARLETLQFAQQLSSKVKRA